MAAGYTAPPGSPAAQPDCRHGASRDVRGGQFHRSAAYRPYRARLTAEPGLRAKQPPRAAAHCARALYPEQAKEMDKALQARSRPSPTEKPRSQWRAARRARRQRRFSPSARSDGTRGPTPTGRSPRPGSTFPPVLPAASRWGEVTPFALKSGRPVPARRALCALRARMGEGLQRGQAHGREGRLGALGRSRPTWPASGRLTGPATPQPADAPALDSAKPRPDATTRASSPSSHGRRRRLIAVFDAKYTYNFWRPVTAIRNGDLTATMRRARSPAGNRSYRRRCIPSIRVPTASARRRGRRARALLRRRDSAVKLTSTTAPGVTRSFVKLSDYVQRSRRRANL